MSPRFITMKRPRSSGTQSSAAIERGEMNDVESTEAGLEAVDREEWQANAQDSLTDETLE